MLPSEDEARVLVSPVEESDEAEARPSSSSWSDRLSFRQHTRSSTPQSTSQMTLTQRWRIHAAQIHRRAFAQYERLTPLQRAGLVLAAIVSLVLTVLIVVYNERIFGAVAPLAQRWRDLPGGWLILFGLIFVVSFPPLIGYSTLLSVGGFVYGFPGGWPIVAGASLVGSAAAFVASRYVLRGYVARLMQHDRRFTALALTIKHDGLKLLVMIRLCPLPYSLSNGALSTIPTVTLARFVLATALVSPKLLVHVFVGAQLGRLAEHGGEMDARTKAVSYLSIGLGALLGAATAYLIWRQTEKRARELEQQEYDRVRTESVDELHAEYADDPRGLEAAERLREAVTEDDISLQTEEPWDFEDDVEADAEEVGSYHDSPSESEQSQQSQQR